MPFQYHIRELTAKTTTAAFVERFVWVEKFLPLCRRCDSYGTRWTCPPFDFDPMTIWHNYTGLLLYARILQADTPEQPLEEALAALAGTCHECEACEKTQGRPCKKPELLRYSIEALGGDVEGCLQQYFHMPMLWGRAGKAPDYLVLVGGLLLK